MARGFKSGGRTKGVQNVITRELKEMIFAALEDVGGQNYLAAQAKENPTAFLSLIGKLVQREMKVDANHTGLTLEQLVAGSNE